MSITPQHIIFFITSIIETNCTSAAMQAYKGGWAQLIHTQNIFRFLAQSLHFLADFFIAFINMKC